MLKFTVVTCTYNSEKYLEKNIKSVLEQSCRNFEQIFIDSFSKDGTLGIIEKYYDNPRIYSLPPGGVASAMNQGVEKAKGEYIIHLHSDDSFYDKEVLSDVARFLEDEDNPDWIYGQINFIDENDEVIGLFPTRKVFQKFNYSLLKYINYIPHQATFVKRDIFKQYGLFNSAYRNSMDYDFWLRLGKKITPVFFERIVSNYRKHMEATSYNISFDKRHEEIGRIRATNDLGSFVCTSAGCLDYLVRVYSKYVVLKNK